MFVGLHQQHQCNIVEVVVFAASLQAEQERQHQHQQQQSQEPAESRKER